MNVDTTAPSSPLETIRGWGWLVVSAVGRVYLSVMLALAACAILPMLGGLTGSVVQSGSMAPLIEPGDVVLTTPFGDDEPAPLGGVITFAAPEGSAREGLVLHRLVAVDADGGLITAGDANAAPDSAVLSRADIEGRAVVLVPWIGLPSLWLTTGDILPLALWLLVTIGALLLESRSMLSTRRRHRLDPPRGGKGTVRAAVAGVAALVAGSALVVIPPFGQADAAFSDQTSAVGSGWTYPAAPPATHLVFATQPSPSTGGVAFGTQPVVEFRDANGRLTTVGGEVTLELTSAGGASLRCTANPVVANSGVAAFAGCAIDKVGNYTLTARSGALTPAVSAPVLVTRGPAVKLQFVTQPSSTSVASTAFATQPVVAVQDAGGNTVTSSTAPVALSLTTPGGATLACTANPRNAASGLAAFSGCRVNRTGTYTLTATSGSLGAATSTTFVISPGAAARLVFVASPSDSTSNDPFATQPVVVVQDSSGNTVTTNTALIDLVVTGEPSGTVLHCPANPVRASAGVAAFSGCSINKRGTFTLTARSGTLAPGTSASFTVTGG